MPEQLWFTAILNHLFAGPVTSLLLALHIKPKYPTAPIPNSFAMEVLVFAFLLTLFLLVRSQLSVDRPRALQHAFEGVEGFIQGQSDEIIGHHSEGYTAFLAVLALFILFCNLIGVIPGFESPTAVAVVPLGCALCAFVYYNAQAPLVAVDDSNRNHQPFGSRALADHPPYRQYAGWRSGHLGFHFTCAHRCAHHIHGITHWRVAAADLHLHPADHRLSAGRGFGRALKGSGQ